LKKVGQIEFVSGDNLKKVGQIEKSGTNCQKGANGKIWCSQRRHFQFAQRQIFTLFDNSGVVEIFRGAQLFAQRQFLLSVQVGVSLAEQRPVLQNKEQQGHNSTLFWFDDLN
jgi:hypothetical protein